MGTSLTYLGESIGLKFIPSESELFRNSFPKQSEERFVLFFYEKGSKIDLS